MWLEKRKLQNGGRDKASIDISFENNGSQKDPEKTQFNGPKAEPFLAILIQAQIHQVALNWSMPCSPRIIQHSNVRGGAEADSTVRKQSIKCMAMVRIKLRCDLKKK